MSNLDERVRDLHRDDYKRISNRLRSVARLPEGKTGLEALREVEPVAAYRLEQKIEREAADTYRRIYARRNGNALELDEETFNAFKRSGGESSW